jgi:NadR type nicotinamide-nucleotide adenylyltransferase
VDKILRIAVVGPESTGKTTLTEALAQHYRCAYTKEYARYFLEEHGPDYTRADLLYIARGQLMVEAESQRLAADHGGGLVFCDTDMITIRIWSEEKYGACDPLLKQLARDTHYDLWLLCAPDMPWEADPLRENPHDRDRLFAVWERELKAYGFPYVVIEGDREQRLRTATNMVDVLLQGQVQ